MWKNIDFNNCLSYISAYMAAEAYAKDHTSSQLREFIGPTDKIGPPAHPSITISRMCGAGGRTVASELVDYLQVHTVPERRWTIFDKNLIQKVLEDHHLSQRIATFLPESRKSLLTQTLEQLRGAHPPMSLLVSQTVETVWNLANNGYVILVGRAGNVIAGRLDNVFHVRLVASLEKRIARVREVYNVSENQAREYIRKEDTGKHDYLKDYFGQDIDNPLIYHMTINTDKFSYETAAKLIGDAVICRNLRTLAATPAPA